MDDGDVKAAYDVTSPGLQQDIADAETQNPGSWRGMEDAEDGTAMAIYGETRNWDDP